MNSSGAAVWQLNGVVVSDEARGQYAPAMAPWQSASPERIYVSWTDTRGGVERLAYVERLDFNGMSQWTPDGVVNAQASLANIEAFVDHVKLEWYVPRYIDATVYRRTESTEWAAIGSLVSNSRNSMLFVDDDVLPGESYGYRLGIMDDDQEAFAGEGWVTVPSGLQLALQGLTPNPAAGDLVVAFTLPIAGNATLELLDVTGRRVRGHPARGCRGRAPDDAHTRRTAEPGHLLPAASPG